MFTYSVNVPKETSLLVWLIVAGLDIQVDLSLQSGTCTRFKEAFFSVCNFRVDFGND